MPRSFCWVVIAAVLAGCASEPPPPASPYQAYVELRADRPGAALERRAADGEWVTICSVPCERTVRVDGDYRVAGEGVTPSRRFALEAPTTIVARTGSSGLRTTGNLLVGFGVPVFLLGALALLGSGFGGHGSTGSTELVGSLGMLGGAGMIVGGVVLVGVSSTAVDLNERSRIAKLTVTF